MFLLLFAAGARKNGNLIFAKLSYISKMGKPAEFLDGVES